MQNSRFVGTVLSPSPNAHSPSRKKVDVDPNPTFNYDADLYPIFQIKAQNLEKVPIQDIFPYILAIHLQIDADLDPDTAYQFDADLDSDPTF